MLGNSRMRHRRRASSWPAITLVAALAVAGAISGPAAPAGAAAPYSTGAHTVLGNGVSTWPVSWNGPAGQVRAHVLSVNLAAKGTSINAVQAHGTVYSSHEQVLSMAQRTHAVGGVNGDFFNMYGSGAPWGGIAASGHLLKSPNPPGDHSDGQFFVTNSGRAYIRPLFYSGTVAHGTAKRRIGALNSPSDAAAGNLTLISSALGGTASVPNCAVAMLKNVHSKWVVQAVHRGQREIRPVRTGEFALTSCGASGAWIARSLRAGYRLTLTVGLHTQGGGAVSAHTFLSGGRILVNAYESAVNTSRGAGTLGRNPETVVCVSQNARTVQLVVIDGREQTSAGVTMAEAATFLIHQRCYTGMLLDGGYSTIMVTKPSARSSLRVMNTPANYSGKRTVHGVTVYSGLRPVANGLFVYTHR